MSNATQHSRESGERRRRRSRGGKNRNRSQGNRDSHDQNRNQKSHRSEEFRPQGPRPSRHAPPAKPLSWWQKILAAVGLYKAPAAPAKPERKPEPVSIPKSEPRQAKSNTRNARTHEGTERSGDSPKRRERGERGERGESRSRGGDGSTVESNRVYVGNLSYDVTEQDLQELFKGIGGVRNVEIVYNRSTHRSKGYGFVEMLHKDEAVRSVEVLHDQHFMGRKLIVSGAKSKGQDEREDSDESPARESRPVVVAPIRAAAVAQAARVETTEPLIPTIVETVSEPTAEIPAESETKAENA
jgi:hypothetical protein